MQKIFFNNVYCKLFIAVFFTGFVNVSNAQIITTIAGNGTPGHFGDGGPATAAEVWLGLLTVDVSGNLYFGGDSTYRVRVINPSGIINTFAGNGLPGFGGDGGPATAAQVLRTAGVLADAAGNIYVGDFENSRIRVVAPTGIITTFAGNGTPGSIGDGGPATAAELQGPNPDLADALGNIYIVGGNKIRKVDPSGVITTFAGTGVAGFGGDGGPATAAQFRFAAGGMAIDKIGNIYVADMFNNRIRKIDTSGIITTIAGSVIGYFGDGGLATAALFSYPGDVKLDPAGNIYVADLNNHRIRRIDHSTGIITTVAGNGTLGFSGDGGPATAAEFNGGAYIAMDCSGNLYVRDDGNNRIRKVTFRHPPHFMNGHTQSITACEGTAYSVDSVLAVIDSDVGLTDIWSAVLPPSHGTLVAAYSTTTTGDTLTPSGLSYTPTLGYTGYDTFKVVLANCNDVKDSTIIYVHILPAITTPIIGPDTAYVGHTIMLSEASTGGVWSAGNTNATVSAGIVLAIAPGVDTISYSVSNACGTDTVSHVVHILPWPSLVGQLYKPQATIELYPNPNSGTFTLTLASSFDEGARVIITNPLSEKIKEITLATNTPTAIKLDAPAGLYFISATIKEASYNAKIILAK